MAKPKKIKTRLEEYQVDLTPGHLVLQVLSAVADHIPLHPLDRRIPPRTMLDPSAGAGIWARCVRDLWPDCSTLSLEVRPEEERNLERNSDDFLITRFEDWRPPSVLTRFDLIATNPPFRHLAPKKGEGWIPRLLNLLDPYHGVLILYALNDLGQRSKAGSKLFQDHPPTAQFRIPGAVAHREDGKVDLRSYSAWVWHSANTEPCRMYDLPMIPGPHRKLGSHLFDRMPGIYNPAP